MKLLKRTGQSFASLTVQALLYYRLRRGYRCNQVSLSLSVSESAPLVQGFELRTQSATQGWNFAGTPADYRIAFEGFASSQSLDRGDFVSFPTFAVAGSRIFLVDSLVLGEPLSNLRAWR